MESFVRVSIEEPEDVGCEEGEDSVENDEGEGKNCSSENVVVMRRFSNLNHEQTFPSLNRGSDGLRHRRSGSVEQGTRDRSYSKKPVCFVKAHGHPTPVVAMPSTEVREAIKSFTSAIDQALQLVSINSNIHSIINKHLRN